MNESILLYLVSMIFFVVPAVGVVFVYKDIANTRAKGRVLDEIASGLRENINSLSEVDIAEFDGAFSNWLEGQIEKTRIEWAKASLRLAIQAKFLGLGEGHRELLIKDPKYRNNAINTCYKLANAYECGQPEAVLHELAELYSLFLCKSETIKKNKRLSAPEVHEKTVKVLNESSDLIRDGEVFEAQEIISDALKSIAYSCDNSESGLALLVLHWSSIQLQDKERGKPRLKLLPLDNSQRISAIFRRIASSYNSADYWSILNVMAERY